MAAKAKKDIKPAIYLNLDEIVPEKEVVVKLKGKEHKLAPITLDDFIFNTKLIQSFADGNVDPIKETEAVKSMLRRSFPSMEEDDLGAMSLPQLNALLDFAKQHGGQSDVEEEAASDAGNPPTAG